MDRKRLVKNLLLFTDYKIVSNRIYKGLLLVVIFIIGALIIGEIAVDLRATELYNLVPFFVYFILLVFVDYFQLKPEFFRPTSIIAIYLLIELNQLSNPNFFHVLIFWFPFVAFIALIIQGLRSSQFWLIIILITIVFNSYHLEQKIGDSYQVEIFRMPFMVAGSIFTLSVLSSSYLLYILLGNAYEKMRQKTIELSKLKEQVEKRSEALEKYQQTLLSLTKHDSINKLELLFKKICVTAVENLKIDRASIWLFEDNKNLLRRKFIYQPHSNIKEKEILHRSDYENYFHAIKTKPHLKTEDYLNTHFTSELDQKYNKPEEIKSILNCPIIIDNNRIGVICCETQREIRKWGSEDILFVQSLEAFIAICYKNEKIKNLLNRIRKQNDQLIEKGFEIKSMNEELKMLNEELTAVNESLEHTVKERTNELENQNKQLSEYAFINSHLLRAPLSRILGLADLISREETSVKDKKLVKALLYSSNELDMIINKISDLLYDGNDLSRKDINEIISRNFDNKN